MKKLRGRRAKERFIDSLILWNEVQDINTGVHRKMLDKLEITGRNNPTRLLFSDTVFEIEAIWSKNEGVIIRVYDIETYRVGWSMSAIQNTQIICRIFRDLMRLDNVKDFFMPKNLLNLLRSRS